MKDNIDSIYVQKFQLDYIHNKGNNLHKFWLSCVMIWTICGGKPRVRTTRVGGFNEAKKDNNLRYCYVCTMQEPTNLQITCNLFH